MSHFVSIGCEGGGPETRLVCELKVPLFQALQRCVTASHTPLVDEYFLVLRVDGTLQRYGEEGLARLRFVRTRRYITVDIQIPMSVWQPLPEEELRAYIARQTQAAIGACIARLEREGAVNGELLNSQVRAAITDYLGQQHAAA
jgi:hypothetical protein